MPTAPGRLRRAAIVAHRYVGLGISIFLVVAGSTGAVLAFYHELDGVLNPALKRAIAPTSGAKPLDPFELERRFAAQLNGAKTDATVHFALEPGASVSAWVENDQDHTRETFVDPYTGRVLGSRDWGNLAEGFRVNLLPFLYRLHYSLALGDVGMLVFGVVALLWTIDCFVGAYLTFPPAPRRDARRRAWPLRWWPAWLVRTTKLFSFVFTWHRASGLWLWGLLLVFAWSAVGLNLPGVYRPVMRVAAGLQNRGYAGIAERRAAPTQVRLALTEAHAIGRRLMAEQAKQHGFAIVREERLQHYQRHGAFLYEVVSSLDISERFARTQCISTRRTAIC